MKIVLAKIHESTNQLMLTARQYPVNVGYLAQVCIDAGYEVEMWDFCVEPFSEEILEERIKKSRPDMIGVSCVTSAIYSGHLVATVAKRINENIVTLIGGVHVTALPKETMEEFPNFDLGVLTEAEGSLLEICAEVEKGIMPKNIPGTIHRENGKLFRAPPIMKYPDLNKIPYPNRSLIPMELYKGKHVERGVSRKMWNVIEVDSSRGCPFSCTFCNVEITHGHKVRYRTPENVHGEIEQCVKKFDTNFVVFNDSTFTIDKNRAREIVEGLPKLGIEGFSMCTHVNCVDERLMTALKKSGCRKISFGVESGSERVLYAVKKNSSLKRIREAFDMAKKVGIPEIEGTFIIGADIHETEEDTDATEKLICELSPDILGLGIITPFPGTGQYDELKSLGHLDNVTWDQFQIFSESPPPWRTINFLPQELLDIRNRILKSYYWSFKYCAKRVSKVRSLKELIYYASMARSFFLTVVNKPAGIRGRIA